MLQADPIVFISAALMILTLPMNWVISAILAAVYHECCHIAVLRIMKGRIRKISIQRSGCIIETDTIGDLQQFLSILAGPVGSISLLFLCHTVPRISLCGFLHGIFNLIPILPLDGGRLLRLLLLKICPGKTESVMNIVALILCILFLTLAVVMTIVFSANPILLIAAVMLNIKVLYRKIPCKLSKLRVQ